MENDNQEDLTKQKVKDGFVTVLKCVAAISSAASVVNPILGVVGSLTRIVLHQIDDENMRCLKHQFQTLNRDLDKISQQNHEILIVIEKHTLDTQYRTVEGNLKNQFRKFMEMVQADGDKDRKKEEFLESFVSDLDDQNLHTLYDGIMGKPKLFSQPILEVYLKYSKKKRYIMEELCKHVTYLFCIGLIALVGYYAIQTDETSLVEEWSKRMEDVQVKMEEALSRCQ